MREMLCRRIPEDLAHWSFLKPARRYFLWVTQLGGFSLRSAALRLFKVESDINGILPAGGGPLF